MNNSGEIVDGNDLPFKYMLKTVGDQFQAVGMKKVDLKKLDDIRSDDRLSEVIKEDIIRFANKIEEEGQDNASLTIYSPNLIEAPNTTSKTKNSMTIASYWQPTVYYTGYGSQRYKDEVLDAENYTSQTGQTDFSNAQFAQDWYNKIFYNAAKTFVGEAAQLNPYTNILAKLVDIFGVDPYVGGSESDAIKVFFVEDKWRKYTSIMYPYSDYKLGAISDQFWLDVYTDKIQDGIVTREIQNTSTTNQYYYSTDQKAYEYKSSMGYWDNRTTQHEFYGITFSTAL